LRRGIVSIPRRYGFNIETRLINMILTIGNTKGGVGKSTLAVQLALGLALDGQRVWLVDGDRQGTSLGAITVRAESGRAPIAAAAYPDGATLRAQVTQQAGAYDHVIIDAGGRDSTALRAALTVSDLMLVPFQPRSFDVWALSDVASLLREAHSVRDVRALALLNAADPQGTTRRRVRRLPTLKASSCCRCASGGARRSQARAARGSTSTNTGRATRTHRQNYPH
jgi:chromosome partitioning protein